MRPNQRVTMSQIGEVLDHAIEYLKHVNEVLAREEEAATSERVRMLLTAFGQAQQALTSAIERYQEDASDRVLGRFINFSAELPAAIAGPESADTTLAVTEWLIGVNGHLVDLFSEVADSVNVEDVKTAFTGLANQIETHERKLSKEYQRFEDL
jgi:hypothetical protein